MAKYEGIITPILTPFTRDEKQEINYEATKILIDFVIEHGASGLFILGSNGEFHVMSEQEKIDFMKFVIEYTNRRVPVYVGTGVCSTHEVIRLTKKAEEFNADAVSVITPYFIKPSDEELIEHYKMIAKSTSLPIILYNIPKSTGINISKEVLSELAKIPNIQGIKDSSGDIENLTNYIEVGKEHGIDVLVGSDSKILEALKLGASGAVAGTSNVIMDTVVGVYRSFMDGNMEEASRLQEKINILRGVLPLGTVPSIMKRSAELMGIPVGAARYPVKDTDTQVDEKIIEMLKEYGLYHE